MENSRAFFFFPRGKKMIAVRTKLRNDSTSGVLFLAEAEKWRDIEEYLELFEGKVEDFDDRHRSVMCGNDAGTEIDVHVFMKSIEIFDKKEDIEAAKRLLGDQMFVGPFDPIKTLEEGIAEHLVDVHLNLGNAESLLKKMPDGDCLYQLIEDPTIKFMKTKKGPPGNRYFRDYFVYEPVNGLMKIKRSFSSP